MKSLGWKFGLVIIISWLITSGVSADDNQSQGPSTADEAIKKGVEWLKAKQIKDGPDKGSWGPGRSRPYPGTGGEPFLHKIGITALALYALLSCDVPPEDAVIKDGFTFIEQGLKSNRLVDTYEHAVILLALEALADARAKKKKSRELGRIIFLLPNEKALAEAQVEWLESAQSAAGGWRYGPKWPSPGGFDEDISQTQVALLGLNAALRLGLEVKPTTWLKALKFNLSQQEKDGPPVKKVINLKGNTPSTQPEGTQSIREDQARGWAYLALGDYADGNKKVEPDEARVTGCMTTAGIASLIICRSALRRQPEFTKSLQQRTEKGINDGLAWLETYYTVTTNPGVAVTTWDYYYYLYGLERVGMLGNITLIGSHNWYLDGSEVIVKKQFPEGYWMNKQWWQEGPDVIDTSFALLFLEKATKPILSK